MNPSEIWENIWENKSFLSQTMTIQKETFLIIWTISPKYGKSQ